MNYDLESFVDRLVAEKGFAGLDESVMTQIKKDLFSRVENRINATIVEKLGPAEMEEFEKKLDAEVTSDALTAFLKEVIPNLDEVVAAELLNFRQTYLNL